MPIQSDFPDIWSDDCPEKRVKVEIRVRNTPEEIQRFTAQEATQFEATYSWIEIPTTNVEQYTTKSNSADIKRTAKVEFPTEWAGESVRDIVVSFDPSAEEPEPFQWARVWFKDDNGVWVLTHHGFVGSVGATEQLGESKLWVYDPSEIINAVPVSETFNRPSIEQFLDVVSQNIVEDTPVPLIGYLIIPPDTEDEFIEFMRELIAEPPTNVKLSQSQMYALAEIFGSSGVPAGLQEEIESQIIFTGDSLSQRASDVFELVQQVVPENPSNQILVATVRSYFQSMNSKSFTRNKHVLVDVLDWLAEKSVLEWHFEPMPNGVYLIASVVPERRTFAQQSVAEDNPDLQAHELVRVVENNALYEMNPVNTLYLNGVAAGSVLENIISFDPSQAYDVVTGNLPSDRFPSVKVQVPSLVQAAGGYELAPKTVTTDAVTLREAEYEAVTALQEQLSEIAEGTVTLRGVPRILPYDSVLAYETCGDKVDYQETPIRYEVEEVVHKKDAEGYYTTDVFVSIYANADNIEVVESNLVDIND